MNQYAEWLEVVKKLITIVGDKSLSETKTWLEVRANAEALRLEGHEETSPEQ